MQRTYYIRYNTLEGEKFDKITYKSPDDRPNWHKVGALNKWKKSHKGYGAMTILNHVFTIKEYKEFVKEKRNSRNWLQ